MSWEFDYRDIYKCNCGKGYIVSESYSDDWNNSESYEYTDCKECYEKMKSYQESDGYALACIRKKRDYTHLTLVDDINKYCKD